MAFQKKKIRRGEAYCRARGVTLLELLIAISLAGVLSAIALPSYQMWLERNAFRHFATHLTNTAKQARIYALTQKRLYYLIAEIENANCVILSDDENCTCSTYQHCALNNDAVWVLPSKWNAKLSTLNAKDKTVVFNQHGTLNFGTNATFNLSTENFEAKVTINPLGRVKLCSDQNITGVALC